MEDGYRCFCDPEKMKEEGGWRRSSRGNDSSEERGCEREPKRWEEVPSLDYYPFL